MPVDLTNCWTFAEDQIKAAVANSAAFQEMVGATDAAGAAAFVYGEWLPEPVDGVAYGVGEQEDRHRAFAQVYSQEDGYARTRTVSGRYEPSGVITVYLQRTAGASARADDVLDSLDKQYRSYDATIQRDIEEWIRVNGGPFIRNTTQPSRGWNPRERWEQEGALHGSELVVEWGYEA